MDVAQNQHDFVDLGQNQKSLFIFFFGLLLLLSDGAAIS